MASHILLVELPKSSKGLLTFDFREVNSELLVLKESDIGSILNSHLAALAWDKALAVEDSKIFESSWLVFNRLLVFSLAENLMNLAG